MILKKIIEEKLREATKIHSGKFFCEDTSVYFSCLNGFPGPLIKWLLKSIGVNGIYEIVSKYPDKKAITKTVIGYYDEKNIKFFEGSLEGEIVFPRGESGFGWDQLFLPKGFKKTMSEMSLEEKNNISMRKIALKKLKAQL